MDGILNINKPPGKTSFSIVALVRRLSGERRVGHAGTLDPMATGVLPVCLGQGTRVTEFLVAATKAYQAQIELGVTTDTYDASGKIIQRQDPSQISQSQFESALASFRGSIAQTPPMYSAVKHQGKRLYQLAREGVIVNRESREIRIDKLELMDWQPPFATIEVVCSKGTYIRSLANDLGEALGCGATLKELTRLRCGPFHIQDSVSVPRLEEAFRHGNWQSYSYPIDTVLQHLAAVMVNDNEAQIIKNGGSLVLEDYDSLAKPAPLNRCRAYNHDGRFLGILCFNSKKGQWQPKKVFL